jgi:hypothetical protein
MKIFIITLLNTIIFSINVFGQNNKSMLFSNNDFLEISPEAKYLVDYKIKEYGDKVYLSWRIVNDSIPGFYLIFKSNSFQNLKPVATIKVVEGVKKDLVLMNTIDDLYEYSYNFYHIVKINRNQNILIDDNSIKSLSIANIKYDPMVTKSVYGTNENSIAFKKEDSSW